MEDFGVECIDILGQSWTCITSDWLTDLRLHNRCNFCRKPFFPMSKTHPCFDCESNKRLLSRRTLNNIKCPKCLSKTIKNGNPGNFAASQKYKCKSKDCSFQFVLGITYLHELKKEAVCIDVVLKGYSYTLVERLGGPCRQTVKKWVESR